jgi:hypothetical protein
MNGKRKTLSPALWFIAAIVVGLAGLTLISAPTKAAEEPNKAAMAKEKQEQMMKHKDKMERMYKCTEMCVRKCDSSMQNVSDATAAIKAAVGAIDSGDTKTAKSELAKAENLLTTVHKSMEETIESLPCVNTKCPISGKAIDTMDRPKDCTRMYKGMKVGFCCPNCPLAWDKLTDKEKDAKLKASMPSKE